MKLFRWLRQVFWAWVPHRCRYERLPHPASRRLHGVRCLRCGAGVWFDVKGCK